MDNTEVNVICPLSMIGGRPTSCVKFASEDSRCLTCVAMGLARLGDLGKLVNGYPNDNATLKVKIENRH